jgi:quinol-cytochrome oxidoreductase complex cytochrome b subunit
MIKIKTYIRTFHIVLIGDLILFLAKDIILENLDNSKSVRNLYNIIQLFSVIIIAIILIIINYYKKKEHNTNKGN